MIQPRILVIYSRYTDVQVGLFEGSKHLGEFTEDKRLASSSLLLRIDELLMQHSMKLPDINLIAASAGPAPFTTLRVVIATVNGLGFATGIPLLGLNMLELLCKEAAQTHQQDCVALLNAFCEDVYFGIYYKNKGVFEFGFAPIKDFLATLATHVHPKIFVGNAAVIYQDAIKQAFGDTVTIIQDQLLEASLLSLAQEALIRFEHTLHYSAQIEPLYLKPYSAKMSV